MKNILTILAVLIFSLGFSQVKKPVKKKYIPKKKYIQKKKVQTNSTKIVSVLSEKTLPENNETLVGIARIKQETDDDLAKKILKTSGSISTRNYDLNGKVSASFKGIYVYQKNNKIYFLLEIDNKSLIDYSVDGITISKKGASFSNLEDENIEEFFLKPIAIFPNQSVFKSKTKSKVVLVFKKFSISENTDLELNITEKSGERDLQILVKGKWFVGAKSIR